MATLIINTVYLGQIKASKVKSQHNDLSYNPHLELFVEYQHF